MNYLKTSSYVLLSFFTLALAFGCAKQNLQEDQTGNTEMTIDELKAQIQSDDLTIALKEKGQAELYSLITESAGEHMIDQNDLKSLSTEAYRSEYFEAIKAKYVALNQYSDEKQTEIVFDVIEAKSQVEMGLLGVQKTPCEDLFNGAQNAIDAAWVFLDLKNYEGMNDMLDLANEMMKMIDDHCL